MEQRAIRRSSYFPVSHMTGSDGAKYEQQQEHKTGTRIAAVTY